MIDKVLQCHRKPCNLRALNARQPAGGNTVCGSTKDRVVARRTTSQRNSNCAELLGNTLG